MIVIPMAGTSRRFREAGYLQPKYMLDLHGKSLFDHSLLSFAAMFETEPFLFIARDEASTRQFVETHVEALGIADARVSILPSSTSGQAETVMLGLSEAGVAGETSLTIFNIDTFRPGFHYPDVEWMGQADGYLEVMRSTDPGFSFVRPVEGTSRVAETAEKEVISDLASTGLYYFRRASDFVNVMQDAPPRARDGELYVAPMYNDLIRRGLDIRYQAVPAAEVIFCGVPQQYDDLLSRPAEAYGADRG